MGNDEFFRKEMSEAYLVFLPHSGRYPYISFYLKKPDTGIHRTLLSFTREGIVLNGDLMLGQNASGGITSSRGYGLEWFKGNLSRGYLASKFLKKVWVPERAVEWVKYELEQDDEDLSEERKKSFKEALAEEGWFDGVFGSAHNFGEWFDEVVGEYPESIGYDYDPNDVGWLGAVQERFAELYSLFESYETIETSKITDEEKELLKKCTFTTYAPQEHTDPGYPIEYYMSEGYSGTLHLQRVMS